MRRIAALIALVTLCWLVLVGGTGSSAIATSCVGPPDDDCGEEVVDEGLITPYVVGVGAVALVFGVGIVFVAFSERPRTPGQDASPHR